jgi:hypothetical protein
LPGFKLGQLYRETLADKLVEFVGQAFMNEQAGENLAVFRYVASTGALLIATQRDFDLGQVFEELGDVLEDEMTR